MWKQQNSVKISLNLQFWYKNFVISNHMGCPAVISVKLKKHLQIHLYFPNYLQPSLIWSDGNVFPDKAKNMCFDWSNNSGDFFHHKLVKIILTILRRNISSLKLQTNVNAYTQIYFAVKSLVIPPHGNPPLAKCVAHYQ